ncbi:MAG: CehA/McbA family metallohydrolase [Acidobacteriales bacterium]|nr:CehA/McbA family metallohydrolase [Terriglobales bacterium]
MNQDRRFTHRELGTGNWQLLLWLLLILVAFPASAQLDFVLKQIDLPHHYYWREMYIPQLTSGPSAACWLPDSETLVYSMQGTLWRQRVDSTSAQQLTAGSGYDYQPDCSRDGRWVVYSKYDRDAIELWLLDLESGTAKPLTKDGHVNLEARWSPDGTRIAYVSTAGTGHLHIFLMNIKDGVPQSTPQLTKENKSEPPRYYYSQFDHEISPAWSPDGSEIIFVSNRGRIHGTGGFWRMKAELGAEAREIRYEETTWRARPDWSPDGRRVVYGSYLGRQWHQLWLMTAEGGDVFPISYGEYDNINPRWSPNGKRIAFISNRPTRDPAADNVSLWVQDSVGGAQNEVVAKQRRYLKPMGQLNVTVLDENGTPTFARVFVTGEDQRAYAPDDAWIHGDEKFERKERPFEPHYYHTPGKSVITVPAGKITVQVVKGFGHHWEERAVTVASSQIQNVTIRLRPISIPADGAGAWVSGDVHVHMNYAGNYRNTPANLVKQAMAEDLGVVNNLIVNKEQRVPDIAYFNQGKPDAASTPNTLILHSQEFHTSYWGHMGLLGLKRNILLPDYAGYPNTASASLYPTNTMIADLTHAQGGLVGFVHLFDTVPDPSKENLTHTLPVEAALGKVDYYEVIGFADHKASAEVWYKLLNLGFHIAAAGGTDAMANYASLHGPVGLNRVYVKVAPGKLTAQAWLDGLKRGRTFATNGPLLRFTLGGKTIGDELKLSAPSDDVRITGSMRSLLPVDYLEVVCNGQVVKSAHSRGRDSLDISGTIPISQSGWCLLRTGSEKGQYPILDYYLYATTSPIYITVAGAPPQSKKDAQYFIAWIDRVIESAMKHPGYNSEAEKQEVLKQLRAGRAVYEKMQ